MKSRIRSRIHQIVRALKPYDPERVILFGSAARGEADPYSDIDLVVIKNTNARFLDRLGQVYDLIHGDFALDALVYTPQEFAEMQARENSLIERVLAEGIIIYERPKRRSRQVVRPSRVRSTRRTDKRG